MEIPAAGVGIVFFGIMVVGALRRKAGNVVARAQYPKLASKLGLNYSPSPYKKGVGKLSGQVDGYSVVVDPDDQRRIYLRFLNSPAVELHSFVHNKRAASGLRSFRPSSAVLAGLFKTSHASAEIIERLNHSDEVIESLRPLKFLRPLKTLSVTSSGIAAVFDFGNPPYIPAEVVDDLLPRLCCLARTIEG